MNFNTFKQNIQDSLGVRLVETSTNSIKQNRVLNIDINPNRKVKIENTDTLVYISFSGDHDDGNVNKTDNRRYTFHLNKVEDSVLEDIVKDIYSFIKE